MRSSLKFATLALGLLLIQTIVAAPAQAAFLADVTTTITRQAAGDFLYSYRVTNDPISTIGMSEVDIVVDPSANLSALTGAAGFFALYTPGDSVISFESGDISTDLAVGTSGVFSFRSFVGPGRSTLSALSFDDPSGNLMTSNVIISSAVPEPASLILLGLGLPGVGLLLRGRSRQRLSR